MTKKFDREQFVEWGKTGGQKRAASLTPAQRRKIASKAAKTRELYRAALAQGIDLKALKKKPPA